MEIVKSIPIRDQLKTRKEKNEFSLPEMSELWQSLGNSMKDLDRLQAIHITGSKGKGSTCAFIESILRQHDLKTGLYTSPHLCSIRERICINGVPISEEAFGEQFFSVKERIQKGSSLKPSFFRMLTLMALDFFLKQNVDVAIIEVGIGGRYDCTNIIPMPLVCGITSIELEHQELLGQTLSQIAWHKAGIIKRNRPVFVAEGIPEEAFSVILQESKLELAPLKVVDVNATIAACKLGIEGALQRSNASLATEISTTWMELTKQFAYEDRIANGLQMARIAGRHQKVAFSESVTLFFDAAHTSASVLDTSQWFKECVGGKKRRILVFYCSGERDYKTLIQYLLDVDAMFVVAPLSGKYTPEHEQQRAIEIYKFICSTYPEKPAKLFLSPLDAGQFIKTIYDADILFTGSFYLVGGMMQVLEPQGTYL